MHRGRAFRALLGWAVGSCGGSAGAEKGTCQPDDSDGIVGGSVSFDLTVDDTGFTPAILPAQNATNVTLTLHNAGASIPTVAAGATGTTMFVTPNPEGI